MMETIGDLLVPRAFSIQETKEIAMDTRKHLLQAAALCSALVFAAPALAAAGAAGGGTAGGTAGIGGAGTAGNAGVGATTTGGITGSTTGTTTGMNGSTTTGINGTGGMASSGSPAAQMDANAQNNANGAVARNTKTSPYAPSGTGLNGAASTNNSVNSGLNSPTTGSTTTGSGTAGAGMASPTTSQNGVQQ